MLKSVPPVVRRLSASIALVCLLLISLLSVLGAAARPALDPAQLDKIMQSLAEISGMPVKHRVKAEVMTRPQLREYLEHSAQKKIKPRELRAQELTLKKFGLVPVDYDLRAATLDLLTEQAAAFYDDQHRRMVLVDDNPNLLEEFAVVHELAHALADQHFALGRYVQAKHESDDSLTARQAVAEGQAMWLAAEYTARQMGQSLRSTGSVLDKIALGGEPATGLYPTFDKAPLYLRESLMFPYREGFRFQHALVMREGNLAFRRVFRMPPASTQQILHPDRYLNGVEPVTVALPKLRSDRGYTEIAAGTVGEMDHSVLLRQFKLGNGKEEWLGEWRGGAFRLQEAQLGGRLLLTYGSAWGTEEAAQRWFDLYRQILQSKLSGLTLQKESADTFQGAASDGEFVLRRQGKVVTCLEGLASITETESR